MNDKTIGKFIGYIIGTLLVAALFYWMNGVLAGLHVKYWQWIFLVCPVLILPKTKWIPVICSVLIMVSCVAQVAEWVGLLKLPLIHL